MPILEYGNHIIRIHFDEIHIETKNETQWA